MEWAAGPRNASAQAGAAPAMGAAIDHQPAAADAHLEGRRARVVRRRARRRRGVDDHRAAPRGEALEPGVARIGRRPRFAPRRLENRRRAGKGVFAAAVERREAAVAVAQGAQRRRHALDGLAQFGGRLAVGGAQDVAAVDEVGERREVNRRRTFAMTAVRAHLFAAFARQTGERRADAALAAAEAEFGAQYPAQRGDTAGARRFPPSPRARDAVPENRDWRGTPRASAGRRP